MVRICQILARLKSYVTSSKNEKKNEEKKVKQMP